MERSGTSLHSPGPRPGTLSTAPGAEDAVDLSHRQELSTSSSHCCCYEPEFDPALLLIESRHDALDSPSTLCIRVPSPLAWGRINARELRAQRRHLLGDGGRSSILTALPFSLIQQYGRTCCRIQRQQYTNCCCINTLTYPGMTLLYPSKLSQSLRISNGTNLKCFDCF